MKNLKKLMCVAAAVLSVAGYTAEARAEYPEKPITLVSPYGAGGDSDLSARVWAEFAKKELGQPVLVVNKTGGSGLTGTLFAAKAKPDGYTLFIGQPGPCIMTPLLTNTGGLSKDSFDYAARFLLSNGGIAVRADAPWNNLKEFEEHAVTEPNKYIYSNPSSTSWLGLAFRSWLSQNKIEAKMVEYTSGAEAATSVMGNHGDITALFPPNFVSLVAANKIKLLALGKKDPKYPDVPSFAELGYDGAYYAWAGITLPKGAPQEVIDKLIAVTEKISKDPEFITAVTNLGFEPDLQVGAAWKEEIDAQYNTMKATLTELGFIAK